MRESLIFFAGLALLTFGMWTSSSEFVMFGVVGILVALVIAFSDGDIQ